MRAQVLVDRKDSEGDVVELLNLYTACAEFHTLPRPGGTLDQPARLIYLLLQTSTAIAERSNLDMAKAKAAQAEAQRAR